MRLIDADALRTSIRESIEECREWANEVHDGEMYARVSQSIGTFVECSLRIKNAPTVDAVERKRGEWVKQMDELAWWYECSVCGDYPLKDAYGHESLSRFCPWCGADMRGEANETD